MNPHLLGFIVGAICGGIVGFAIACFMASASRPVPRDPRDQQDDLNGERLRKLLSGKEQ